MNYRGLRKLSNLVFEILTEDYLARTNDTRLIRLVYEKLNLPTNLYDIETTKTPSFSSVVRVRRKVQELNPFLNGDLSTKHIEKEFKKLSRL